VGRLCVSGDAADPVEVDGGTTVLPSRVLADVPAPLQSGDPQSIAGS